VTGADAPAGAVAYGIDVGGTKILGVALSPTGAVLAERKVPTPDSVVTPVVSTADHEDPVETLANAVACVVDDLRREVRPGTAVESVGIGLPGLVATGALLFAPHLPNVATPHGLERSPSFSSLVAMRLSCVPMIYNDANLAAVAEITLGAERAVGNALLVTLGTGIGGAIVIDGEVRVGAHGLAAEFGHMVVDPSGPPCPCGRRGCWERYASGGGLARLAREAALAGTIPEAVVLAGGHPELVRGEHVTTAASRGDKGSLEVVEQLGWWVALGLANLSVVFDPDVVVVGGGLVAAGEMLLAPTRSAFASLILGGGARPEVRIVPATLGEGAGAIGAALASSGFLGAHAPRR
jgi:glucokinase